MAKRSSYKNYKIVLNSPVVLTFAALCVLALVLQTVTGGRTTRMLFSVYRSSLTSLLTYPRFFLHVLGHADAEHLINNMMYILLIGPALEEKYGSGNLLIVIIATAFVTGLVHFILFPNTMLLGASGVVFAFILLSAAISFRDREIPITFILVALLYLGDQVYSAFAVNDNISQLTHILGGITGTFFGYLWRKK